MSGFTEAPPRPDLASSPPRFDVRDGRAVDRLERSDLDPAADALEDADRVKADRLGAIRLKAIATVFRMRCADCREKNIPDPEHMGRTDLVCVRCEEKVESDVERRGSILRMKV